VTQGPEFLVQLFRAALGRTAAEEEAPGPQPSAGGPDNEAPAEAEAAPVPVQLDAGILGILGEKVLLAWLRNRHQLLFPFAFDLHRLDRETAQLVVHAMIAAAQADGTFDVKERERIEGALALVNPDEAERGFLVAALDHPRPLHEVLREVREVQTGALVYAASLIAVDQRKPVNRHYLRYLATRLQLSEELVGSLEQRFRSSG